MTSRIHTQNQHTKKETQDLSNTPVEGMFKARPFVVQAQKANQIQQPDLKTSLIQAKHYGHHLNQIDASVSNPEALQPKMEIGKPVQLAPKRKKTSSSATTPTTTGKPTTTPTTTGKPATTPATTGTGPATTPTTTSTGPATTPTTTGKPTTTPVTTSTPATHATPTTTSTPATHATPTTTSTPATHATPATTSTPATHATPAMDLAQAQALSSGGFVPQKGGKLKAGDRAGGFNFGNKEGKLPAADSAGNPISYKEYDVNPKSGKTRDGERIVVGSDGTHWHTTDHYASFNKVK